MPKGAPPDKLRISVNLVNDQKTQYEQLLKWFPLTQTEVIAKAIAALWKLVKLSRNGMVWVRDPDGGEDQVIVLLNLTENRE